MADILNSTNQTNYGRERNREKNSMVQEGTSGSRLGQQTDRRGDKFSSNPASTQDRRGLLQNVVRNGNYVAQRLRNYTQGVSSIRESEFTDAEHRDFYSKNPLQRAVLLADKKIMERPVGGINLS